MKFENNQKNRLSLALVYLAVFFIILSYFYRINYIDFITIRSLYIPIIGISMLAIMLNYLVFGHVFIVSSLFGLIIGYTRNINPGINGMATSNTIIIFGLVIGLLLQMYMKIKKRK